MGDALIEEDEDEDEDEYDDEGLLDDYWLNILSQPLTAVGGQFSSTEEVVVLMHQGFHYLPSKALPRILAMSPTVPLDGYTHSIDCGVSWPVYMTRRPRGLT